MPQRGPRWFVRLCRFRISLVVRHRAGNFTTIDDSARLLRLAHQRCHCSCLPSCFPEVLVELAVLDIQHDEQLALLPGLVFCLSGGIAVFRVRGVMDDRVATLFWRLHTRSAQLVNLNLVSCNDRHLCIARAAPKGER